MKRDRNAYEATLEIEHNSQTVEYVVTYSVTPYERERGPTYDCAGTPSSGGDVEEVAVWFEHVKRCAKHRFGKPSSLCRECKPVRERREELDDLVNEDDLVQHADDVCEGAREDAEESRADACREARDDR